jgi:hypothetical protein
LEKRCLKEVQWEMVIQEGAPHCSLACSDQSSADPVIVELGTTYPVFVLAPVGIPADHYPFQGHEAQELVSNLVDTLRGIHRLEWTHLDLRLSNVVIYEPRGALRRWYLIDSEYATKIGDPVPKKRYTGHYAGEKAEAVHDFAQLRGMMSFLLTSEQINDRLSCWTGPE